jgi:pimeloyl-ACP methyl ester carboxylesterase
MKVTHVPVGEVELSVAESGTGLRPFLLLHGFTGAKEDFTDVLDPFADRGWWAVAPDHRGHGDSSKPAEESAYSAAILAADAAALTRVLGWDRYVLLGHSMGGMVAQHLALAEPERIAGLVLMDTTAGPIEGLDPEQAAAAQKIVRESGIDVLADIMATREGVLSTPAHERLLAEVPGYAEFGERKFRATSPALYAALVDEFVGRADLVESLRSLTMPALVIVGDQDAPFIGPSERMAEALPDAELVVIPNAGHSPQFENPVSWLDAIESFLGRVDVTAPGARR